MTDPVAFVLAALALLATPGPTNTLLAAAGALQGRRTAMRLIPAEITGYLLSAGLLALVAGPAVAGNPALAAAMRLGAAIWLIVSATRLWSEAGRATSTMPAIGPGRVFVTTVLNPKVLIVAFVILPAGDVSSTLIGLLAFGALAAMVATGWITLGALGVRQRKLRLAPAGIARGAAAVLTVFATVLAGSAVASVL